MPFNRLEQICSNAASLICGAAHGDPETFQQRTVLDLPSQREAALVARRTADGFKASLADRDHAILAWPWDHIATRVAWLGTQSGDLALPTLGQQLDRISIAYALVHAAQLTAVIDLWRQVATGVTGATEPPNLDAMGLQMFLAFVQAVPAPV